MIVERPSDLTEHAICELSGCARAPRARSARVNGCRPRLAPSLQLASSVGGRTLTLWPDDTGLGGIAAVAR